MRAPPAEPDVITLVPKVMTLSGVEGEVGEVPLPEVELLEDWVPPKGVTQVFYQFILDLFVIFIVFFYLT